MKYRLDEIKEKAIPIACEFGVGSLSLFGSYARGEAREDSDLDFYINVGEIKDLFEYCNFVSKLEDAFNCDVDVVTTDIDNEDFLNTMKKEGILLYKR